MTQKGRSSAGSQTLGSVFRGQKLRWPDLPRQHLRVSTGLTCCPGWVLSSAGTWPHWSARWQQGPQPYARLWAACALWWCPAHRPQKAPGDEWQRGDYPKFIANSHFPLLLTRPPQWSPGLRIKLTNIGTLSPELPSQGTIYLPEVPISPNTFLTPLSPGPGNSQPRWSGTHPQTSLHPLGWAWFLNPGTPSLVQWSPRWDMGINYLNT